MTKRVTTRSDEGFSSVSDINGHSVEIDATGEENPDTLESLLATYASCYVPALRVAGEQRDAGDLGRIDIAVTGELNEDDKLASTRFDITTETDLSGDQAAAVINRADALCKVQDALRPELRAEVTVNGETV